MHLCLSFMDKRIILIDCSQQHILGIRSEVVKPVKDWCKGWWFSHSTPNSTYLQCVIDLQTGDWMSLWTAHVDPSCVFCSYGGNTRPSFFFFCHCYSSRIWEKLTQGLLQDQFTITYVDIVSGLTDSRFNPTKRFILWYLFQACMHSVWCERNKRRHGKGTSPTLMTSFIASIVRNTLASLKDATSKLEVV